MVTILPAFFSTTSYSWHYKDDNQILWRVSERDTIRDHSFKSKWRYRLKTGVETFFRRQSCITQYLCAKESCILKCNQVAREKTSTHGWVFIFSKLNCILQALKNHHAEDHVAHDLLRVRERERKTSALNRCIKLTRKLKPHDTLHASDGLSFSVLMRNRDRLNIHSVKWLASNSDTFRQE